MFYYAATIALSAFLLFLVQPIIAKQILPWFGGSAAVWTTCMVFFQCTLLAGYFYSDFLARRLSLKKQVMVHAGLLILSLAFLPNWPYFIAAACHHRPALFHALDHRSLGASLVCEAVSPRGRQVI
jgi:hypothetical protein